MITKARAMLTKMLTNLGLLWAKDKVWLLALGALLLAVKVRESIVSFLVSSGKKAFTNATKTDATLAGQEAQDNNAANKLVQDANAEPSKEKPVADDWYTKT